MCLGWNGFIFPGGERNTEAEKKHERFKQAFKGMNKVRTDGKNSALPMIPPQPGDQLLILHSGRCPGSFKPICFIRSFF